MYIGKLIIIDNRLMGRFNSNEEIIVSRSRCRRLAIIKTKLKAMWYDYFIVPQNKAIHFKVYKESK